MLISTNTSTNIAREVKRIKMNVSNGSNMDRENIISNWFAISTAHANINTSLYTCVCDEQKKYCATISVGMLYDFSNADSDIYKAIERTISQYSQWVIENESKES